MTPELAINPPHRLTMPDVSRVDEMYRPAAPDRPAGTDPGRRQRVAAVVAAYHIAIAAENALALVIGWRRQRADGPIDVYAGGLAIAQATRDGGTLLSIPPGARSRAAATSPLLDAFTGMPHWTRLAGVSDGLLVDESHTRHTEERRPSIEDCLLRAWQQPFAWLVLAEPVPPAAVSDEAARIAELERDARTRNSPEYTVRALRLGRRHQELRAAQSVGLWRTHVLAGGATRPAARTVAGLLAASADLTDLPYLLAPTSVYGDLTTVLTSLVPDDGQASPFLASSALIAALAREPSEEIPGLRLIPRPSFDVTPEPAAAAPDDEAPILLGRVLDRNQAEVGNLHIPRSSLNRHTFVTGATGSGKSQTVRALLTQATEAGLPWLVVEPAKAEYRAMANRIGTGSVVVLRPGDPAGIPAGINPLQPAPGYPLQTHADLVRALFTAAFQADEPFPQVLSAALTRCYVDLGWDLALSEALDPGHQPRYPTLSDLQRTAEQVVADVGYGREVTDNVLGFIRVRLSSLRIGTTGRFLEGGHPIDFSALMRHNVVLEIEDVGDDRDKAFLMGTVLIRLVEHLRVEQRDHTPVPSGLRHLTVIEEAHRLLRHVQGPGPAAHAVELFAALLAEIRAYGEGLIIADQIPSKLVPDVIKNTAGKIVHRLPAADDRAAVGATINLTDEQSRYLVTLSPGTAAVFTDGMDYPMLARMPDGTGTESVATPTTASPAALVEARSNTCAADCGDQPCTLRQVRAAQRLLETDQWLALWAELSVLAHLTGWEMPAPRPHLYQALGDYSDRLRDCAISHAVDRAVASRAAAIVPLSPRPLATHVADAIRADLTGMYGCADEEPEWLATPFRWSLVHDVLKVANRQRPNDGRHPRSTEWERRYQHPIPGATTAEQLAVVGDWFDAGLNDQLKCDAVAFGVGTPSIVESAIGVPRTSPDWSARLDEALTAFGTPRWPCRYLTPNGADAKGSADAR